MNNSERRQIINQKRLELQALREATYELSNEINTLEQECVQKNHSCACVLPNSKLFISTMAEQEQAGRNGLSLGLVANNYSAAKACPTCKGTGIAK